MDGLAGAFANFDFVDGKFTQSNSVVKKYFVHDDIYPEGYVTKDNSWVNYTLPDGGLFGWNEAISKSGSGVKSFGAMLSESEAFSQCMVKRTFKSLCSKDLKLKSKTVAQFASQFKANSYKLRDLFVDVAISKECNE
jgi:hypothetical protein